MQINIRSMNGKTDELQYYLDKRGIDIACISETFLAPDDAFSMPGYQAVRKDFGSRRRGGALILIRDHLSSFVEVKHSIPETACIDISLDRRTSIRLISVYFSPSTPPPLDQLEALISSSPLPYFCAAT
jgi:hypothetical protein